MSKLDPLIQDLVIANRILAKEDVVDACGHVSVRHPDNPKRFFISRSLAPELIEKSDIVELPSRWCLVDAPHFQYAIVLPGRTNEGGH